MQIEILYFDACPNYRTARAHLEQALRRHGELSATQIKMTLIKDEEHARARAFAGSPTILVDGHDMFGTPEGMDYGLRCRIYLFGDRATGVPTVEDFVRGLDALDH